jgi:hypothetical protein
MPDAMLPELPSKGDSIENGTLHRYLDRIRPVWKGKQLIHRVQKLVQVDPSSACQRLLNAAFHDLRQKVILAGIDLAQDAAANNKLPPINTDEDIENYSVARLIDLCYRMGILARSEWRRLHRSYEIRRDLEHEDDEYEAQMEDCVYIFKTAIDIVLSKDPVTVLQVTDIKQVVENPEKMTASEELLSDYADAPLQRQEQILEFLISSARDSNHPDIVRQNSYEMLRQLEPRTPETTKIAITKSFETRLGRNEISITDAKIASACGILPYLKRRKRDQLFHRYLTQFEAIGPRWTKNVEHGRIISDFEDIGGLDSCPDNLVGDFVDWFAHAYVGEPGGYGTFGRNRKVFYSNSAASYVNRTFPAVSRPLDQFVLRIRDSADMKEKLKNKHLLRRFEDFHDLCGDSST